MDFFAANGVFYAVCGIFCCLFAAALHPGWQPQAGGLPAAGRTGGALHGAYHERPAGAYPGKLRRAHRAADCRGGARGQQLFFGHSGRDPVGGKREQQPGGLPHHLCRTARLCGGTAGAGPVHAATTGHRRTDGTVCRRHRAAGRACTGKTTAYRAGRERQLPCPHPPLAAKTQREPAPGDAPGHRRRAGCHDGGRPQRAFGAAAQRLPGCGAFPCAGGQRNARFHPVRGYPERFAALSLGAELPPPQTAHGLEKSAGAGADGCDWLYTLGAPRRRGGVGQRLGCVGMGPGGYSHLAGGGRHPDDRRQQLCGVGYRF